MLNKKCGGAITYTGKRWILNCKLGLLGINLRYINKTLFPTITDRSGVEVDVWQMSRLYHS